MQIEICEICEKTFVAGYGYSIMACWIVTGSAHVTAYTCPNTSSGQHWGCCPEHAVQALEQCLNDPDHLHVDGLMQKHKEAHTRQLEDGTTIEIPRYSEEDAKWAAKRGKDFHLVNIDL